MSDLQSRIDALSPDQRELFERALRERRAATPRPAGGLARRAGHEPIPLSFAQERFWFLSRMEPDRGAYNTFLVAKLEGALDVPALEASFREIVRRHEVLRTAIDDRTGQPTAALDPEATVDLRIVDLQGGDGAARAQRLVDEEIRRGFDLRRAPFLRAALYRLMDDEHWLAVTLHHVASDRWSTTVLIREVAELYAAFSSHQASRLPDLPLQYADFAAWQREWFTSETCAAQMAYWRRQFADDVPPLQLSFDRPRRPTGGFRGASVSAWVPPERVAPIHAFCQQEGVTLFMTALTAFDILLSRYADQTDFAVGCPVANRREAATQRLIGCFVNTLALRCRLTVHMTGRALLEQVRETCLAAYTHQDLPFERLVDELNPPRTGGHSPFFQVIFNVNEAHDPAAGHALLATTLGTTGLRLTPLDFRAGHVPADLLLQLDVRPDGLSCRLDYDTDLFDESTIAPMLSRYLTLLEAVTAAPDRRIAELPMLSPAERRTVLDLHRGTGAAYPHTPVHVAFSEQARRTPDRVAVSGPEGRLTYGELDRRAARLARELVRRGIGRDAAVALFLDRSHAFVISMLAVLKAGGAYMPLDLSYPEKRLAFMLRDAGVRTVLTETSRLPRLSAFDGDCLCVDRDVPDDAGPPETWNGEAVTLDDIAYVMYTSGSTGEPKGVQIPHRGVLRLLHGVEYVHLGADECLLQFASLSFDAATFEVWGALLHGGRLVLSPERVLSPKALGALLAAEGVTILWLTASLFNAVIDEEPSALRGVRQLLIGGEALSVPHVRRALDLLPETQIVNGYGPTESTTFACCHRIPRTLPDALTAIPIGRPIANTSAHILDEGFEPTPIGVPGMLWLGGDGLARAYLRQPALTAEKFVPDPFSGVPGARLYGTGDRARLQPDGTVDFLGRRDGQLKVRGFRIEAGEVEAALVAHPHVTEAAAVVRDLAPGDRRLIAYLTTTDGDAPDEDDLRRFLRARLPEFAVPSFFVTVAAMPLSPTGKLERRALPAAFAPVPAGPLAPPGTPLEEVVLGIWRDVLGTDRLGVHDDFFDRGGHSLLATRIVSRVRDTCGVTVPLRDVFNRPTPAGLASVIERLRQGDGADVPPLVRATGEGEVPISFAQQRLWFLDQWEPGSSAYVIPAAVRLRGALDVEALRQSFDLVVRRHAALRTIFRSRDGQPIAIVQPPQAFALPLEDLGAIASGARDALVCQRQAQEAARPFRLDEAPLLRASALRFDANHHVLLMAMHHIASDGWSVALLLRELAAGYEAQTRGRGAALDDLPVQYGDYAAWQRAWLEGPVLERQLAYWRTQLEGAEPVLRVPTDRPRPTRQTFAGARQPVRLSRDLSASLAAISRQQGVTLFMTLLAAFQTLLARYTGQTDITVGTPVAGRVRREIEPLIGFFVNTLALRCDLSGNPRFVDLLAQVRDVTLDAYTHQDVPFERVIEELQPARDASHSPLFQVMLVLQNTPPPQVTLPGLRFTDLAWASGRSKFDLTLELAERGQQIVGAIEYNTGLFDAATIRRLAGHFETLLRAVVSDPTGRAFDLPLIPDAERRALVARGRGKTRSVEPSAMHESIARQAARAPNRPAIVGRGDPITYRRLDRRANALAWRLSDAGVGPETRVGICLERSAPFVIAVLAVWKAGGACVPLDPAAPTRVASILDAAGVQAIVTERRWLDLIGGRPARVMCLDEEPSRGGDHDGREERAESPRVPSRPQSLSCVLYDGAEAARPAGVALTHRNASAYLTWVRSTFSQAELSAVLALLPANAASTIFEFLAPLGVGGTLVLADGADLPASPAVSFVTGTPSGVRPFLRRGHLPGSVRTVALAGEPVTSGLVAQIHADAGIERVVTLYGPLETSACAASWVVPRDAAHVHAIGRPVANTQVYLLDARLEPVPTRAVGEVYVGGLGLARGYCDRPALTADRFVPNPFADGERLYRTGDLARARGDGVLELVGRRDRDGRTRGFLVEVSEAHLRDHPAVADAAVVARDEGGERRLVAYVAMREGQEVASRELRHFLAARLPSHMVPTAIARLPRLPRLPDGAIDRQALPPIDEPNATRGGLPRTPLEEALAAIWTQLLRVDSVARETDFFDAGGNSLLATQLVARVRRDCHVDVPLKAVFESPTIAAIAERIEIVRWAAHGPPVPAASDAHEEICL